MPKPKREKRARKGKGFVQRKLHSTVVQTHHISYIPEITVRVYKGEHFCLTLMGRRKRISKGFIVALKDFILKNEQNAEELKMCEEP